MPLKRGGADNASNVQWQAIESSKIKNSSPVLPEPLLQVQGPTPPQWVWGLLGGPWRAWYSRLYTRPLQKQFADAGRLRSGDLPGEGDMGRSMGRIFMNSKLLYHSIA